MRVKKPCVVITFASTSDAMAMEQTACSQGIPGRIIPVPSEIDAGCGLAWCASAEDRELLLQGIQIQSLAYETISEITMY